MFNAYVIYMSMKNSGDVNFSATYPSFNKAKSKIDAFLEDFALNRGKTLVEVDKKELEKIRASPKKNDKNIYVKKKKSAATLFHIVTIPGRLYNTYELQKLNQVGISEFSVKVPPMYLPSDEEEETEESYEFTPVTKITNHEHGSHVSVISELKSVLRNRKVKNVKIPKSEIDNSKMENFIHDLIKGKEMLTHISPPTAKLHLSDTE